MASALSTKGVIQVYWRLKSRRTLLSLPYRFLPTSPFQSVYRQGDYPYDY